MRHLLAKHRLPHLGNAGNAVIETALAFPVVLTLMTGIADFGLGAYDHMQVESAVRAGTQVALKSADNTAAIQLAVETALTTANTGLDVSVTKSCQCADGVAVDCNGGACDTGAPRTYVTVGASLPHQWLFPYPGIPASTTFTAQSVIRTQ